MTTETTWADFVNGIIYNDTATFKARRYVLNQMIDAASNLPEFKDGERTNTSWIKEYALEGLKTLWDLENIED
ncbi:hypothetical protein HMPREF1484_02017 [Dermabacter sp. HFH0086]|uniref:hypothetical protein n=1 Tax=Dermabacter TaxID=36739 RepID=UPI0003540F28|nr:MULTISPECIES: hypothetical protein [Dermabacter]EPH14708.1 hypothetical protein HMPREF1484_02017 [Dermabacter sp. HFH0086]